LPRANSFAVWAVQTPHSRRRTRTKVLAFAVLGALLAAGIVLLMSTLLRNAA
jgi:hypothetical protein